MTPPLTRCQQGPGQMKCQVLGLGGCVVGGGFVGGGGLGLGLGGLVEDDVESDVEVEAEAGGIDTRVSGSI